MVVSVPLWWEMSVMLEAACVGTGRMWDSMLLRPFCREAKPLPHGNSMSYQHPLAKPKPKSVNLNLDRKLSLYNEI